MDLTVVIYWVVPVNLPGNYDKIRIYRSQQENVNYQLIDTIDLRDNDGNFVTQYNDQSVLLINKDYYYYLIKFYDSVNDKEYPSYYLTTYAVTPREQRLINSIRNFLGPYISENLTDNELAIGIKYAIQLFNQITPITNFDLNTFPQYLEGVLLIGASVFTALSKYLGVALTDFNYSDSGLSLTIDRGTKITTFVDKSLALYNDLALYAKRDFIYEGTAVGTMPLPISVGGRIGNITAIFDLFNAVGR